MAAVVVGDQTGFSPADEAALDAAAVRAHIEERERREEREKGERENKRERER